MNRTMIRLSGALVFFLVPLEVFVHLFRPGRVKGRAASSEDLIIAGTFSFAQVCLVVLLLWATKSLFDSRKYRSAEIPILSIVVMVVLRFLVLLPRGETESVVTPDVPVLGTLAITESILLIWDTLWLWFGITSVRFAAFGGGLWKATGILYLISAGAFMLNHVVSGIAPNIIGVSLRTDLVDTIVDVCSLGSPVMLAAWICQGIGLLLATRKRDLRGASGRAGG